MRGRGEEEMIDGMSRWRDEGWIRLVDWWLEDLPSGEGVRLAWTEGMMIRGSRGCWAVSFCTWCESWSQEGASGGKVCMGFSEVIQIVMYVWEVCWRRPASKNFYCVVWHALPKCGGSGSDAERVSWVLLGGYSRSQKYFSQVVVEPGASGLGAWLGDEHRV